MTRSDVSSKKTLELPCCSAYIRGAGRAGRLEGYTFFSEAWLKWQEGVRGCINIAGRSNKTWWWTVWVSVLLTWWQALKEHDQRWLQDFGLEQLIISSSVSWNRSSVLLDFKMEMSDSQDIARGRSLGCTRRFKAMKLVTKRSRKERRLRGCVLVWEWGDPHVRDGEMRRTQPERERSVDIEENVLDGLLQCFCGVTSGISKHLCPWIRSVSDAVTEYLKLGMLQRREVYWGVIHVHVQVTPISSACREDLVARWHHSGRSAHRSTHLIEEARGLKELGLLLLLLFFFFF